MLSYYDVKWHMGKLLAPILFDEEHWEAGAARKESVVSHAKKSEKAKNQGKKSVPQRICPFIASKLYWMI